MQYLMMAGAILLFTCQSISFKLFNLHFMKDTSKYYFYSIMYSVVVFIFFMFISKEMDALNKYTIIAAIPFGVLFIYTVYFYAKAMETGPLSYSALIFSFSILIPVGFGIIVMNEKPTIYHLIGLSLLMITFYLASQEGSKNGKKTITLKWFIYALLSMVGNGSLGMVAKWHQMKVPGEQVNEFMALAFIVCAIVSLILYMTTTKSIKLPLNELKQKNYVWVLLGTALGTALGNRLFMSMLSTVDAIILFPVVNGSMLILTGVASIVIFKEKLPRKSMIGFLIGVVAIFVININ